MQKAVKTREKQIQVLGRNEMVKAQTLLWESPTVSSVLARQCLVLRHKDSANRTLKHLLQLGNCHVFSLVRLDAFKYVSCL